MKVTNVTNILDTLQTNLSHLRAAVSKRIDSSRFECSRWMHSIRAAVTLVQRTVLSESVGGHGGDLTTTVTDRFATRGKHSGVNSLQLAVDRCGTSLTEFESGFEGLSEQLEMQLTEIRDMLDCQANALSHFRDFLSSLQKDQHYFSEEVEVLRGQNSTNEGYLIKTRQDVVRLIREKEDLLVENSNLRSELRELDCALSDTRITVNAKVGEQIEDMTDTIHQVRSLSNKARNVDQG